MVSNPIWRSIGPAEEELAAGTGRRDCRPAMGCERRRLAASPRSGVDPSWRVGGRLSDVGAGTGRWAAGAPAPSPPDPPPVDTVRPGSSPLSEPPDFGVEIVSNPGLLAPSVSAMALTLDSISSHGGFACTAAAGTERLDCRGHAFGSDQ